MSLTCRRTLLDKALAANVSLMKGKVLDIGGTKNNKRGNFNPPLDKVVSWQYVNSNPLTVPDFCCDAASIPVGDVSFDTIIMTELLEYVQEPLMVLNEAFRLLKKEGMLIASVPFLNAVHGDDFADRQRFTKLKLQELCKNAGFEAVSVKPMGALFSVIYDFLHVSFSYARTRPNALAAKLVRQLLKPSKPLSLWLDSKMSNLTNYINTGYFLILRKP
ncbi:MAG: methyltransferase domain-containing protein [Phycisphaerae bacterium]|jgi:SAM-dependent methyltransferase